MGVVSELEPAHPRVGQMVKRLPKELKGQLPSPEEIAKLLDAAP